MPLPSSMYECTCAVPTPHCPPLPSLSTDSVPTSPFEWGILGRNLAASYGSAAAYFLLVLLIDALRSDVRLRASVSRRLRPAWERMEAGARGALSRVWAALRRSRRLQRGGSWWARLTQCWAARLRPGSSSSTEGWGCDGENLMGGYNTLGNAQSVGHVRHGSGFEFEMELEEGVVGRGEAESVDSDVAEERDRVLNMTASHTADVVCLRHLRQVYPTVPPKVNILPVLHYTLQCMHALRNAALCIVRVSWAG